MTNPIYRPISAIQRETLARWAQELVVERILQLHAEGKTDDEIAARFGGQPHPSTGCTLVRLVIANEQARGIARDRVRKTKKKR